MTPKLGRLMVRSTKGSVEKVRSMNAKALQIRLLDAGYDPGPIDGRLGPKTREALIAFQRASGLTPDGELGVGTLAKLVEATGQPALDSGSERKLAAVHPDLRRVVHRAAAITETPFIVTEGKRSIIRQKRLVASGASRTLKSRHLTGHAVDLAVLIDGQVRWDWPLYHQVARSMKRAGADLAIPVEWGGDWRTFKDGPHFQLSWDRYPETRGSLATGQEAFYRAQVNDQSTS